MKARAKGSIPLGKKKSSPEKVLRKKIPGGWRGSVNTWWWRGVRTKGKTLPVLVFWRANSPSFTSPVREERMDGESHNPWRRFIKFKLGGVSWGSSCTAWEIKTLPSSKKGDTKEESPSGRKIHHWFTIGDFQGHVNSL